MELTWIHFAVIPVAFVLKFGGIFLVYMGFKKSLVVGFSRKPATGMDRAIFFALGVTLAIQPWLDIFNDMMG